MIVLDSLWTAETLHDLLSLVLLQVCYRLSLSVPIIFILLFQFSLLEQPSLLLLQTYSCIAITPPFPLKIPFSPGSGLWQWECRSTCSVIPTRGILCTVGSAALLPWFPPVPNTEITTVIIAKPLSLSEGKDFHCFKKQCTAYRSLIMLRKKAGTSTVSPTQHLRNMLGSVLMFAKGNSPVMETISGVSSDSYLTSNTFTHIKQFTSRWRISTDIMETA